MLNLLKSLKSESSLLFRDRAETIQFNLIFLRPDRLSIILILAFFINQLEKSAEEDDDYVGDDGSDLLSELLPFLYKVCL